MEKLFKIVEPGKNEPVHGLAAIPADHAQMLMLEEASRPIAELAVGEKANCTFRSSGTATQYDVVRVE